jgi:hypothetical protein
MTDWDIYMTSEVAAWLELLQATDAKSADLVDDAIYALSCSGPALGRPLVDTIAGSKINNLKGTAPWFQRNERDPRLIRVRSMAVGDPPGRWRQGAEVESVVCAGDPAS